MNFFLFHGTMGSSNENWFPWLKKKLERAGHVVIALDFPTPQGQELEIWMHLLNKYIGRIDEGTILVGHSIGCAFILSVLERLNVRVKACVFVAGFLGPLGIKLDEINAPFAQKAFKWNKIFSNCEKFILFQSDNDEYVPMEKATELKQLLNAELIVIKNGGHFNEKAGFTEFPELYDKISELVKK